MKLERGQWLLMMLAVAACGGTAGTREVADSSDAGGALDAAPDAGLDAAPDASDSACAIGEACAAGYCCESDMGPVCVELAPGCLCGKVLADGTRCSP